MRPSERSRKNRNTTGSSSRDEPVFLVIGRVRRPFGLKDEWFFKVITDFPERLVVGKKIYLGEDKQPYLLKTIKTSPKDVRLSFEPEIPHDMPIQNEFLYVKSADLPSLSEGRYYHHQVIGMQVMDEQEKVIGTISEILETGANDVYIIRDQDGKEILLPAISTVIRNFNIKKRTMVVKIPEWK